MYRVTVRQGFNGDEHTIHSEFNNDTKLLTGKITKDVDSIDSFQFSISPKSPYYNSFTGLTTFVKVTNTKLNKILFEGRVLPTTDSMESSGILDKEVTCEGLLAFLQDSVQDYYALSNNDLRLFLQHMIDVHNKQVDAYKKIKLGIVTVTSPSDNVYKSIDDAKTTYETIQEKLIDKYGGEIRLRHELDGLYLDYMSVIGVKSNQDIRLTSNLVSLKRAIDPSTMYSIIKPLGARAESTGGTETNSEISQPRLTIETVNNGSPFLYSQKMIDKIGRVVMPVTWDDVKTAPILKSKGQQTLDSQKEIKEQFQITAVDLSMIHKDVDDFDCGNYHRVINPLQAINEDLRIVGQSIDICSPVSSTLSIGDKLLSQEQYELTLRKQQEQKLQQAQVKMDKLSAENIKLSKQTADLTEQTAEVKKKAEEVASSQVIQGTQITGQSKQISELNNLVKELQDQINADGYYAGSIIDVSEFQGTINWPNVVKAGLALATIRVQSGSSHIDETYASNIPNAISAGANYAVYAYFSATSTADAEAEAVDLYNRTQTAVGTKKQPRFYMIDVEVNSVTVGTLKEAVTAYMNKLNSLGIADSKLVIYVSNDLYPAIDTSRTQIWIPSYGADDGTIENSIKPLYPYDLWQYTSKGSIAGITGDVDMSTEPSARFKESFLKK